MSSSVNMSKLVQFYHDQHTVADNLVNLINKVKTTGAIPTNLRKLGCIVNVEPVNKAHVLEAFAKDLGISVIVWDELEELLGN